MLLQKASKRKFKKVYTISSEAGKKTTSPTPKSILHFDGWIDVLSIDMQLNYIKVK